MKLISADANSTGDPVFFAGVMANATTAIERMEHFGDIVLGHVGAASRESFATELAVVIAAILVTALTCTVLTYALVKSVIAQQSAMTGEIMKRKKTDASVRKFFPSRFMSLLDVVDVNAVVPGLRSEMMLTSFFCDIRGFTELSEQLSPDEVFEFLLEFTELVTPIIAAHNGYIDKFIGDAFLAVFVEPESAALAAVAVQSAMTTYNVQRRARMSSMAHNNSGVAYGSTDEVSNSSPMLLAQLNEMRQAIAAKHRDLPPLPGQAHHHTSCVLLLCIFVITQHNI
jgi:uncharacterized membrane protein YeaQ/YmgE (transglycosylase-associated protein family)